MRIGLVCPYDIFRGGGVQEHVLAQAEELRRRGHVVKIITPRPRKAAKVPPDDVIFIGSSTTLKTPISTSLELSAAFKRDGIDDMLANEKFDVLHIHEPEVPVIGAQIIAKASSPIIATFHAIHPETPMARTIEALRVPYSKSIFSKLRVITAVSDVAAGFVRAQTKRDVHIIPNGIDLIKYKPLSSRIQQQPETIVYVGRLEKRKGVLYLLKAFAVLQKHNPNLHLDVVGDGPDRAKLEEYVRTHSIKHVTFSGFVEEAVKIKKIQNAAVFCSPALYGESFGIVLLEAIALGTVVVAGNNPGYATVMRDTGAVSLVDPTDSQAFASKLELLLSDDTIRKEWQSWAKDYIKQFSYDHIVDMYLQLYNEIVDSVSRKS